MTRPVARWKDLCLDASGDPQELGRFWAAVIGLDPRPVEGREPVALDGRADHERIWVNPVDRPRTVKNRLHLDVYAASVDDLVALGATVLAPAAETGLGWTVMADPEGHELCCFVREEPPAHRLHGVVVDCVDAAAQAAWWGEVLGVPVRSWDEDPDLFTLEHATPDPVLTLDFVTVPEARVGPNRVHWDLRGDPDAVLALGASVVRHDPGWAVLADPEGNEFCVDPD